MKKIVAFVFLSTFAWLQNADAKMDCIFLNSLSSAEIKTLLSKASKNEMGSIFFNLGNCRTSNAMPVLIPYLEDKRITHELRFKGMSYRYMASVALGKISRHKILVQENASDDEYAKAITEWKKHLVKPSE